MCQTMKPLVRTLMSLLVPSSSGAQGRFIFQRIGLAETNGTSFLPTIPSCY